MKFKRIWLIPIIMSVLFGVMGMTYRVNVIEVDPDKRALSETLGYEKRIIYAESRGKKWAYSKAGARGLYQITKPVVSDYNRDNKTNLYKKDVYKPEVGRKVFRWYIDKLERRYDKDKVVMVTNSYNMGPENTKRGRFNHSYLDKVCPSSWARYREGKRVYYYNGRYGVVAIVR
jgi:soluble lytic murein transglycosylase-like protein